MHSFAFSEHDRDPDRDGERAAWVDHLARTACRHRAVRHPYLRHLHRGTLPDVRGALRDFAHHYFGYSAHFSRYLTATMSRLDRPAYHALMHNLVEESGTYGEEELQLLERRGIQREWIVGVPHPDLFARFRAALGVSGDDGLDGVEVSCWRELFHGVLTHGSAAEAVGALGLGTETVVRSIYVQFLPSLERAGLPAEATVFFPLHCDVDDSHQATLRQIAVDLAVTPEARRDVERGMHKALFLRASFWDFLFENALAMPAGDLR